MSYSRRYSAEFCVIVQEWNGRYWQDTGQEVYFGTEEECVRFINDPDNGYEGTQLAVMTNDFNLEYSDY